MLGFYHERELLIDPHLYFGILGHVDSLSYVITLYFNCVVMNSWAFATACFAEANYPIRVGHISVM